MGKKRIDFSVTGLAFRLLPAFILSLLITGQALSGDGMLLQTMPPILASHSRHPPSSPSWWRPSPGTSWQWQLSGTIDTSFNVRMYDIDLFDTPQTVIDTLHNKGRKVICYFSAGSYENWRPDKDKYPNTILGKPLDGWPGEKWVDIRQLDKLGPILESRLDLAVSKQCDGVEPDNIDGYSNNTGFALTATDQLVFNRWLAGQAHSRGLSIGLKNDLDQIPELVNDYDWALNEQCFQYDECDTLLPFVQAGRAVFGVEYKGNTSDFCPKANAKNFLITIEPQQALVDAGA